MRMTRYIPLLLVALTLAAAHAECPPATDDYRDSLPSDRTMAAYPETGSKKDRSYEYLIGRAGTLWGVLDKCSHWIIAPQFKTVRLLPGSKNLFTASIYTDDGNMEREGVRDTNDRWVLKPLYRRVREMDGDKFHVIFISREGPYYWNYRAGWVNGSGEEVSAP